MHEKKCITFLIKITHINLLKKFMIHKHIHIFYICTALINRKHFLMCVYAFIFLIKIDRHIDKSLFK